MNVTTGLIVDDRLHGWAKLLKQQDATPMILLGVGHNRNSGALVVLTVEDDEMDKATILGFLRGAIAKLEETDLR